MPSKRPPEVAAVFGHIVRPSPYLTTESIDTLAPQFEDPAFCAAFALAGREHGAEELRFMQMLAQSANPLGKQSVRNILIHGTPEGGLGWAADHNRFEAAKLIDMLDAADQKAVLCKPGMVYDLVNAEFYHWNDELVVKWIDAMSPADRLEVLCTQGAVDGLLNKGQKAHDLNRPKIRAWFEEQPEEGRAKIMATPDAARGFIQAFGREGLALVKKYMPQERRASMFSDKGSLFLYFREHAVAKDYLESLAPTDRDAFLHPDVIHFGFGQNDFPRGHELATRLGLKL